MCRVVKMGFEPVVSSSGRARRWVAEHLARWELDEVVDVSTLLTSELVANAVVHAASGPGVVLAVADGVVEVDVADSEPRLPRPAKPGPEATGVVPEEALLVDGGRGLLLVDALADEWGATRLADGKQVWFRLSAENWSHRSACRCYSDHIDRVSAWSLVVTPWPSPDPGTAGTRGRARAVSTVASRATPGS